MRGLVERCVRDLGTATGVHLHDTRGTALACVLAALEAGASLVDASVGGVGGCPFAPGAQGNVATEDVVYLLEREGIATGVDLDALIETARWLASVLERPVPGRVQRRRAAGPDSAAVGSGSLGRDPAAGVLDRREVAQPRIRHAVERQADEQHR